MWIAVDETANSLSWKFERSQPIFTAVFLVKLCSNQVGVVKRNMNRLTTHQHSCSIDFPYLIRREIHEVFSVAESLFTSLKLNLEESSLQNTFS